MSISKLNLGVLFRTILLAALLQGCAGCTHLAYHPSDIMYVQHPEQLQGLREEVSFRSSDGTQLAGWFFKARKGGHKGTIIQFHGNAQNMTAHFNSLVWLIDEGYDFFTFDYRGYGISEGKPDEPGLNRDAVSAIHYVMKRQQASPTGKPDIVLYGQSLGGAVLLRAYDDVPPAEKARVKCLVIESSFYNYHEIARSILSRSWITFLFQPLAYVLVSNEYGPQDSIPRVSPTPLLIIHGDQDGVIPVEFGKKIFALAKEPKTFLEVPEGRHIDSMMIENGAYRSKLLNFLDGLSPESN